MKLGCNHPIGPLALADLVGLDTLLSVMEVFSATMETPSTARRRCCEKWSRQVLLGRKRRTRVFIATTPRSRAIIRACAHRGLATMHEYSGRSLHAVRARELVDHELLSRLRVRGVSLELAEAVLEGREIRGLRALALNRRGTSRASRWHDTEVSTAAGWKPSLRPIRRRRLECARLLREFGGQNLPRALSALVEEMWNAANNGVHSLPDADPRRDRAIELKGSERQKQAYLPKIGFGRMDRNDEPHRAPAGSDLAAVRTRAEPLGGGRYKIEGQKIFITYGEHDLTENIVHMVLARTPHAPEGVEGISLFLVPKFMVNPDGSLGERNDVRCASVEHKAREFTAVRPACSLTDRTVAPSASSSARKTAASNTCS